MSFGTESVTSQERLGTSRINPLVCTQIQKYLESRQNADHITPYELIEE